MLNFSTENAEAHTVEGGDPYTVSFSRKELFHPFPHFGCGFIGEGDCQNMRGENSLFLYQISDSVC